jgi:hypothetical protein
LRPLYAEIAEVERVTSAISPLALKNLVSCVGRLRQGSM